MSATPQEPRAAYDKLREIIRRHGGTMVYERNEQSQYGAWVIRLGEYKKTIPAKGDRSFPDFDRLYVQKSLTRLDGTTDDMSCWTMLKNTSWRWSNHRHRADSGVGHGKQAGREQRAPDWERFPPHPGATSAGGLDLVTIAGAQHIPGQPIESNAVRTGEPFDLQPLASTATWPESPGGRRDLAGPQPAATRPAVPESKFHRGQAGREQRGADRPEKRFQEPLIP